jgi:Protein of unknown function (DUF1549)
MKNAKALVAFLSGIAVAAAALADDGSGPAAQAPQAKTVAYWAYQPVQSPGAPAVKDRKWVRTQIDAFVLAKIEAAGLKPSPDADRGAFVRRATLDVWGVIPTPEEVHAFEHDRSGNSYEKLVDRLLASPRYAERQARRWLDLARYADSAGFQGDETRPNMWRYRDYVIKAFSDDKPYDRFVQEQLAGDEMFPDDQNALVATGFLRGYPDNSNSRDLVQKKYQNVTDMTDTVGEVFLAQTVGCARCHNHKTDKITQRDYYQLQSFFANTSAVDHIAARKGEQELAYEQAEAKWQEATKDIRVQKKAIIDSVREKAKLYLLERYSAATQVSLKKLYAVPRDQWTAQDRWIIQRFSGYDTDDVLAASTTRARILKVTTLRTVPNTRSTRSSKRS